MKYITLSVPTELSATANSICVALEPDASINPEMYAAFSTPCIGVEAVPTEENPEPVQQSVVGDAYMAYGAEVVDWLADAVIDWQDEPASLHATVSDAYTRRWPGVDQPTLEQCQQFCAAVLMSARYGFGAGLTDLSLSINFEPNESQI